MMKTSLRRPRIVPKGETEAGRGTLRDLTASASTALGE